MCEKERLYGRACEQSRNIQKKEGSKVEEEHKQWWRRAEGGGWRAGGGRHLSPSGGSPSSTRSARSVPVMSRLVAVISQRPPPPWHLSPHHRHPGTCHLPRHLLTTGAASSRLVHKVNTQSLTVYIFSVGWSTRQKVYISRRKHDSKPVSLLPSKEL